ncbi:NAD(P)-dependent alcohol dehydrogenase [Acidobacteria bacterium AB60]|nr:NAD(P)-dependent alcohol dehydrogenase [Acidobacteria bacterium AB60]
MHAIVYHRYGTPDVLEFADVERPAPGAGEVLIRVRAASVNPYDWHFLRGTPRLVRLLTGIGRPKLPRLGADVSGIVEAVGEGTTHFRPGDAVFGVCKGAFAEFACGRESQVALKPNGISFEQAASLPIAGITALQGLRDCGCLREDQSIYGASGGVGTFAVQIALVMGAWVTGVCSTRNVQMVGELGAHRVLDYTRHEFGRGGYRYDVVFDLVGNRPLADFRQVLKRHGIYVACGGGGPDNCGLHLLAQMVGRMLLNPWVPQKLTGLHAKVHTSDLLTLAAMVEEGKISPVLDRRYPLPSTAEAIRYVEQCHARGKVTIAVA